MSRKNDLKKAQGKRSSLRELQDSLVVQCPLVVTRVFQKMQFSSICSRMQVFVIICLQNVYITAAFVRATKVAIFYNLAKAVVFCHVEKGR